MTNYLDTQLMKTMCHRLAVEIFDTTNDPISKFEEHDQALLESALNNPKATFSSEELYPSLVDKAAILYYSLNKNHPFRNGNKRISLCSLLVFLAINDKWVDAGITEMVEMTLSIAKSKGQEKDEKLVEIKNWISQHLVDA